VHVFDAQLERCVSEKLSVEMDGRTKGFPKESMNKIGKGVDFAINEMDPLVDKSGILE